MLFQSIRWSGTIQLGSFNEYWCCYIMNKKNIIVSDENERMTTFCIFFATILAIKAKVCSDCMVVLVYFACVLLQS